MAPLAGALSDADVIEAAASVAKAFDAELACVHAPADLSELAPWVGDGFVGGGAPIAALEGLRQAAADGEKIARAALKAQAYANSSFIALEAPIWAGLGLESRLSDLVVFDAKAAGRGSSALGGAFRQVLADEQRPVLIASEPGKVDGVTEVAGDGGKEATRAVRTAQPRLQKAKEVVVLTAPEATSRKLDPARIAQFLEARGAAARLVTVSGSQEPARLLLSAAHEAGADLMVAGAFGHPRLQEFIFGGVTRDLLSATDAPALFLSH